MDVRDLRGDHAVGLMTLPVRWSAETATTLGFSSQYVGVAAIGCAVVLLKSLPAVVLFFGALSLTMTIHALWNSDRVPPSVLVWSMWGAMLLGSSVLAL